MRMDKVDDCIWSPKILKDIVQSINLIHLQTIAHFNVLKIDAAKKRGIVFGINVDPVNLNEVVSELIGEPIPKVLRCIRDGFRTYPPIKSYG